MCDKFTFSVMFLDIMHMNICNIILQRVIFQITHFPCSFFVTYTLPLSPFPSPFLHLLFNKQSSGLVYAHLHSTRCHSQADTQRNCCCICQFFKTRSIQSSSLDTMSCSGFNAQKKKKKKLSLPLSLTHSLTLTVGVAY